MFRRQVLEYLAAMLASLERMERLLTSINSKLGVEGSSDKAALITAAWINRNTAALQQISLIPEAEPTQYEKE